MNLIADMHFLADGKELAWTRDPIETYAIHVSVPAGAKEVTARFVHTSPLQRSEGRIVMTPEMLSLQWEKMSFYPAGYFVRQIAFAPTVTVPQGWQVFTALDGQSRKGDVLTWGKADYEQLVDSPILAGKYARQFDLGHNVKLDAVADEAKDLDLSPEHLAAFRKLVDEAYAVHGAFHFDHYDFLVSLSDKLGGIGLEHQRSNESSLTPESFIKWQAKDWGPQRHRARIQPQLGRQVPPAGRPLDARLSPADAGQPAVGLRRAGPVLGQRPRRPLGYPAQGHRPRRDRQPAGYYSVQAGPRVALGRGHHDRSDRRRAQAAAVRRPQPQRGLLQRRHAGLARGRPDHPPGHTRQRKGLDDFAKAFFGVTARRHRPADLHLRRHRRGA